MNISVSRVFSEGWGCLKFRRNSWDELADADMWYGLKECENVILTDEEDKCRRLLTKSGIFSVNSMYLAFKKAQVACLYKNVVY